MREGLFIVIEGADGVGKSTLAKAMLGRLAERDQVASLYSQPSKFPTGQLIREYLSGEWLLPSDPMVSAEFMARMMMADRLLQAQLTFRPELDNGVDIICDRYWMSTLVYQSAHLTDGLKSAIDNMRRLYHIMCNEIGMAMIPQPDLTIFLSVDPLDDRLFVERVEQRGTAKEIYEQDIQFQSRVRRLYSYLFNGEQGVRDDWSVRVPGDIGVVDATADKEFVLATAMTYYERVNGERVRRGIREGSAINR